MQAPTADCHGARAHRARARRDGHAGHYAVCHSLTTDYVAYAAHEPTVASSVIADRLVVVGVLLLLVDVGVVALGLLAVLRPDLDVSQPELPQPL